MQQQNTTLRILALLWQRKRTTLWLSGLVALAAAFDIAVPFIAKNVIDALVEFLRTRSGNPFSLLAASAGAILVATVASRVLGSYYDFQLFKTATGLEDDVRNKAFEKYLVLHALFHHGSSSGQIIGRIERGATAVFVVIYDIFGHSLIPPLMVFVGVFGALLAKNFWIALVVFLPLPAFLAATYKLSRRIYEIEQRANDEFETVSKESYDVASNVLTVKKYSREHDEVIHHAALLARARQTQYGGERLWAWMENVQTLVATLGRIGVIVLAGWFVLAGKSSIGEFVLYLTLHGMIYQPLAQLSVIFPRLRRNISRVERLFAILDEAVAVSDSPDAEILAPFKGRIAFRDVWFHYSGDGHWALKRVSVEIPAGTTAALVGRRGSGKTSFVNMLLRLFDPQRGAVLVDGRDIRAVTQESLRSQVAVVPQEVDLFSRSIAENIAYGKPGATREEIVRAAEAASAHEFIAKTERGYDTVVGERGIKLSGGERQSIGIARALLKNPPIIIFDEATSHLDSETERRIQQAMKTLIRGRTSLVIAHRLSTVLGADMIIVFNEGKIEAVGRHDELLGTSPTYRMLHDLQFSDGAGSEDDA